MSIDKEFYCPDIRYFENVLSEFRDKTIDITCCWNSQSKGDGSGHYYVGDVYDWDAKLDFKDAPYKNFNHLQLIDVWNDYLKMSYEDFDIKYKTRLRSKTNCINDVYIKEFKEWCSETLINWGHGWNNQQKEWWDSKNKYFQCKICNAKSKKKRKILHRKTCGHKLEIILDINLDVSYFYNTKEPINNNFHPFKDKSLETTFNKVKKYFKKYNTIFNKDL